MKPGINLFVSLPDANKYRTIQLGNKSVVPYITLNVSSKPLFGGKFPEAGFSVVVLSLSRENGSKFVILKLFTFTRG